MLSSERCRAESRAKRRIWKSIRYSISPTPTDCPIPPTTPHTVRIDRKSKSEQTYTPSSLQRDAVTISPSSPKKSLGASSILSATITVIAEYHFGRSTPTIIAVRLTPVPLEKIESIGVGKTSQGESD